MLIAWVICLKFVYFRPGDNSQKRYRPVAERGHQPPWEANQNNRERPDHNIGEPVSANHNARKRENHKYNKGDNPRLLPK